MNEQEVRTFLDDLADTPAPPPRVDVRRAVTVGRRQTRVRAWTSAAASVLVVGLAVGVTYAVTSTDNPTAPTGATPVATQPVTTAPERFDPLVRYASFGWLPDESTLGWRTTAVTGDRFLTQATQYLPDPANGPGAALPATHLDVRLYAAGVVPQTEKPIEVDIPAGGNQTTSYGPVTDAPAVNGAPAYWVGAPNDDETIILKWRYAPDAWAELYASRLSGDERQTVHRVASELRVGGTERLRFPFQLAGLPTGLRPMSSQLEEGGLAGAWNATLDLNTSPDGQGPGVSVGVHPTSATDSREPNTTIDNHPARVEKFEGSHLGEPQYSDRLHVYDLGNLQADIIISGKTAADAAPLGPDGALGVYRMLTVHPDRADWTDEPLR
jgi:hypothetical protein